MKEKISTWLPLIIWAAIIFILSSIPSLTVEALGIWDFVFRKLWHFTEFGIFSILLARVEIRQRQNRRKALVIGFFGALAYALTDEWHQTFIAGRFGSIIDVGIDALGALTGIFIYKKKFLN